MKPFCSLLAVAVAVAPLGALAAGANGAPVHAAKFVLTVGGRQMGTFQALAAINSETPPREYVGPNAAGGITHTKQYGKTTPPTITLKRGMSPSNQLWAWHQQGLTGAASARQQVTLQAIGADGKVFLTYAGQRCWPSKIDIGGAKAGGGLVVMETVTLLCDRIELIG